MLQRNGSAHAPITRAAPAVAANRPVGRIISTSDQDGQRGQRHQCRALVARHVGQRETEHHPPTTAPGGLSSPPSTAATNPMIRIGSKLFGPRNTDGATSIPASAPIIAASAQPSVSIRAHPHPEQPRDLRGERGGAHPQAERRCAGTAAPAPTATAITTSTMNVSLGVNSRLVPPTS